jgi:hypothetical protein
VLRFDFAHIRFGQFDLRPKIGIYLGTLDRKLVTASLHRQWNSLVPDRGA